ncbi:MAG: TRAP transporter small permease subunit [Bradyrhizobium sp.]|uniref:TRAP transporter small permease subunit n=1 Tax=Bradyrhizobium sp. TaxID=376 RepID=UPI003548D46A
MGKAFGWCIVIMTIGTCYEVFVRYALSAPTNWAFDLSYFMYGALFMMAGAYTLSRNGHVRGDFLYRRWPNRVQAAIDLVLFVLFMGPGFGALLYYGIPYAAQSWSLNEVSIYSPTGAPVYPHKTLIPLAAFFMLLQTLAEIVRCVICLRDGVWPQRLHDVEEMESAILAEAQDRRRIEEETHVRAS